MASKILLIVEGQNPELKLFKIAKELFATSTSILFLKQTSIVYTNLSTNMMIILIL